MRGWRLGSIRGVAVEIHWTWLVLFAVFAWSLAEQGAHWQPGLPQAAYLLAGAVFSLLVVISVLGHELSHSLTAIGHGMPVRRITLFLFGGVAQIEEEPRRPRDEFLMTAAGPGASFALGGLFLLLAWVARESFGAPPLISSGLGAVGRINLILAFFNLLPGLPLDGGRLLHSLVWMRTGDRYHATRVAAGGGMALGVTMMVVSGLGILLGAAGLLWIFFLGWMILWLARTQLQYSELERHLHALQVGQVMLWPLVTLPADLPLSEAVRSRAGLVAQPLYPITGDRGEAVGVLDHSGLQQVEPDEWSQVRIGEVMQPLNGSGMTTRLTESAAEAFQRMRRLGRGWLLVVSSENQPIGLVTEQSLLAGAGAGIRPQPA